MLRTLAYVDGVNFARRARIPARFSVGLRDEHCPPRSVYAAYNAYVGERGMHVYPFNGHEGGEGDQWAADIRYIQEVTAR